MNEVGFVERNPALEMVPVTRNYMFAFFFAVCGQAAKCKTERTCEFHKIILFGRKDYLSKCACVVWNKYACILKLCSPCRDL